MTAPLAPPDAIVSTKYWHELEDGRIQCDLCPRDRAQLVLDARERLPVDLVAVASLTIGLYKLATKLFADVALLATLVTVL